MLIKKTRTYPEVSPLPREASVNSPPNEAKINSEIQLMRSRDLLRRVHFELASQAVKRARSRRRLPRSPRSKRRSRWRASRTRTSSRSRTPHRTRTGDHVINTLVRQYVNVQHRDQNDSPAPREFFDEQADEAHEAYEEADVELERYDAAHGLTSVAVEKDQMLRQRAQLEADLRASEAEITEGTTKVAAVEAELEYIPEHEAIEVDMIPNPMLGYLNQNLAKLEMETNRAAQLYTPQHRLVMDVESEIAAIRQQIGQQEQTVIGRKQMATAPVPAHARAKSAASAGGPRRAGGTPCDDRRANLRLRRPHSHHAREALSGDALAP